MILRAISRPFISSTTLKVSQQRCVGVPYGFVSHDCERICTQFDRQGKFSRGSGNGRKKECSIFYARPWNGTPCTRKVGDYKYELRPVGIFIIDEAQNYFSSRDFKEAYSKTLIPYMTRHRHYYHSIWWASKIDQVDITFRRTEQIFIFWKISHQRRF